MKRKLLRFTNGTGIQEQGYTERTFETREGLSHISCVSIRAMNEPWVWHFAGKEWTVLTENGKWFRILTEGKYYSIAAVLDGEDRIVLWYIDMIAGQGVNAEGRYYYDDLYLDLIVTPDGEVYVDDMDELEAALQEGDITREQFELALATSRELKEGTLRDIEGLKEYTMQCYEPFKGREPDEIIRL